MKPKKINLVSLDVVQAILHNYAQAHSGATISVEILPTAALTTQTSHTTQPATQRAAGPVAIGADYICRLGTKQMAADLSDVHMASPPALPEHNEPRWGGYSRFEIELEFVQSLANPFYLNHLASQKLLTQPAFVAYLAYLRYWSRPPYLKYLTYPGPTLRHLELLQEERFRQDIMSPDLVARLVEEGMRSAVQWHREGAA